MGIRDMKKYFQATTVLAGLMVLVLGSGAAVAGEAKVLIVGIDGCRPDAMLVAQTPTLDNLWQSGAFSFHAVTDPITYSGPCWTSMMTGVWSGKHGILGNKYENVSKLAHPHFFSHIKRANPALVTASIAHWAPLHKILMPDDADVMLTPKTDRLVTDATIACLADRNPDIVFVHLDDVDHAGHEHGYGPHVPAYVQTIETTDALVGEILSELRSRATFGDEQWLIIISTDHGGIKTGHGKNSPQEDAVFLIMHGRPGVSGELMKQTETVDIVATALDHLGVSIDPAWDLDGRVIGDGTDSHTEGE